MVAVKAFTERPGKSVADLSKENRLKCYYGWTEKGQDPRVNVLTAWDQPEREQGSENHSEDKCGLQIKESCKIIWVVELRMSIESGTVCSLN